MTITKTKNESTMYVAVQGRLDTTTSPQLEDELAEMDGINELVFDFDGLEYISSAGLRILLAAQKRMNKQGTMKIKNVCSDIMDVFDITGFVDILTIV